MSSLKKVINSFRKAQTKYYRAVDGVIWREKKRESQFVQIRGFPFSPLSYLSRAKTVQSKFPRGKSLSNAQAEPWNFSDWCDFWHVVRVSTSRWTPNSKRSRGGSTESGWTDRFGVDRKFRARDWPRLNVYPCFRIKPLLGVKNIKIGILRCSNILKFSTIESFLVAQAELWNFFDRYIFYPMPDRTLKKWIDY